jgi:hypothetical protein
MKECNTQRLLTFYLNWLDYTLYDYARLWTWKDKSLYITTGVRILMKCEKVLVNHLECWLFYMQW